MILPLFTITSPRRLSLWANPFFAGVSAFRSTVGLPFSAVWPCNTGLRNLTLMYRGVAQNTYSHGASEDALVSHYPGALHGLQCKDIHRSKKKFFFQYTIFIRGKLNTPTNPKRSRSETPGNRLRRLEFRAQKQEKLLCCFRGLR